MKNLLEIAIVLNKKGNNKINEKIEDEKETEKEELKFKDIDEILNYINDTSDTKKGKKKYKKGKKIKIKLLIKKETKTKKQRLSIIMKIIITKMNLIFNLKISKMI